MTGGSITASEIDASFSSSKNGMNTLENMKISSGKDESLMDKGISADKSIVTLNNVTITQAETSIFADNDSTITTFRGSFEGKTDGVYVQNGGTIILEDNTTFSSSDSNGLHAEDSESKITMTGKTIIGKKAALLAEKGGQIDVIDAAFITYDMGTVGQKLMTQTA
ncbi:hypothetical protein [Bartonella vinsonii]|uniref:Uncharacterized protein n=1 Tax=Bartonella vinsonii TaxID=33047 RepID=A0A448V7H2_BARVI|nr:hypothetical protein [Bartonella vinsonii]VEJ45716.1 Uncharacterised protein [Bartonella vinsonii]